MPDRQGLEAVAPRPTGGNRVNPLVRTSQSRKDRVYLAVLLVVVFLRLGLATLVYTRPELALANDTDRYRPLAELILSGQAYGWNTEHSGELANTVGYPLFLAAVYAVLGSAPWATAFAQLLLSGALAIIVYLVLAKTLGSLPAFAAAMILAIDPLTALWSLTVLTETVFAFFIGISALLLVQWSIDRRALSLLGAGLFLGVAALVKPYAQLLVVLWTLGLVVFPADRGASRGARTMTTLRRLAAFALPAMLLIAPWIVRNALLWNCPTLSSVDRITMRDYMAAKVIAEYQHAPLEQVQAELQAADGGVCPGRTAEYLQTVLAHPAIYAKLQVAGTIPVLIATGFDRWFQFFGIDYSLPDLWRPYMDGGMGGLLRVLRQSFVVFPAGLILMAVLTLFQLLFYAAAGLGLVAYSRARELPIRWGAAMLSLAVLILVLTPGQGGNERFRVPAQPIFAILAAQGVASLIRPPKAQDEAPAP